MSKLCNSCGSVNGDGQKFCSKCGNAFAQVQMPEQPQIKRPMYENTDYAAIAARKQAPVQPMQSVQQQMPMQAPVQQRPSAQQKPQYQATQNKPPKKKNLTPVIIAVVAAVVVVGVALGVIFGIVLPNKEKGKSESENAETAANGETSEVGEIGDYDIMVGNCTIATDIVHVNSDGTVGYEAITVDKGYDFSEWKDIVAVSSGTFHVLGLKSDGTVVSSSIYDGSIVDDGKGNDEGQGDVDDWTDIIQVIAGHNYSIGLKSDGTVVCTGGNKFGQIEVTDWSDIAAIDSNSFFTVALTSGGTVLTTGEDYYGKQDFSGWEDVVAVSTSGDHTVGLKKDGTVTATGKNDEGQCNTESWSNIVSVCARDRYTVGIKADGTIVITGKTQFDKSEAEKWTDIITVEGQNEYLLGLKSNGTLEISANSDTNTEIVKDISGIKTTMPDEFKNKLIVQEQSTPNSAVDITEPVTEASTEKATKPEDKKPITANEDEIYADFIKNLSVLDISDSFFGETIEDSTFSVKTGDFDSDGKKEMLTFSIVETDYLVIRLYTVENGKVVLSDETEKQQIVGGGHYVYNCCASLDSNVIRLHCSTASFGGSSCGERYLFYRIENNKINLTSDYVISEFYRYNSLVYENKVTGEKYDSAESLRAAAVKTGFYPEGHFHKDEDGNLPGEEVANEGSHVFVYFCSSVFEGTHRIIYDNSDI